MSLKMFGSKTKVTIAIEDNTLRILMVKGQKVQAWMNYPLPPELSQEEIERDPRQYQRLLSFLFFDRESLKRQTLVSIPGNRALFNTISLPKLKDSLGGEAVERETRRQLSIVAGQAYLFWQAFRTSKDKQDFLSVAVLKHDYDRTYHLLKGANLRPRLWDLKPLALVRAVGKERAIILDLERDNIELILVSQGVPIMVRSMTDSTDVPHEELARRLATYVSETLAYYDSAQHGEIHDVQNSPVVLTGDLAGDHDLVEAIRAVSYVQVEQFYSPLEAPPEFPAASYAAALGLALKNGQSSKDKSGHQAIDFNVCPEEYSKPAVSTKAATTAFAILVGAALLFPAWQVHDNSQLEVSEKYAKLAPVQRDLDRATQELALQATAQNQINQTLTLVHGLEQDLDTVLSERGEMAVHLHSSLNALPPEVNISSYSNTKEDTLTVAGDAKSYGRVLSYAKSLEENPNFADVTLNSLSQRGADEDASVSYNLTVDKEKFGF